MTTVSSANPSATKSTLNSTTTQTTNLQNSSAGNSTGNCAMAHDFFGSQAFSNSIYTAGTGNNTSVEKPAQSQGAASEPEIFVLNENPQNLASYLLNEHFIMEQEKALAKAGKLHRASGGEQKNEASATTAKPKSNGAQSTPTVQDYYMATQIANQFANMSTLSSPYTSYTDRDYFAQSTFNPNGYPSNGFNVAV